MAPKLVDKLLNLLCSTSRTENMSAFGQEYINFLVYSLVRPMFLQINCDKVYSPS